MRKLVDAPRKKKQWTEKEEAYLQDKWGTVSIKGLSKALGRSEKPHHYEIVRFRA